ncbi:MAG: HEAT repeat domain-containing protein [Pirellulales bacterium]
MRRSPIWTALACVCVLAMAPACSLLRDRDAEARVAVLAELKEKDPVVRADAVRELQNDPAAWTSEVIGLLDDEHPRVRIAALEALPPGVAAAEDNLLARLRDPDIGVRLAAIAAAGRSQLPAAQAELRELTEASGEAVRAAAVAALATAGDRETVRAAVTDKAWQVRLEVARGLAQSPDEASARLIRDLMTDATPAVRLAAVQSIGQWPPELAVPLLLEDLEPGPRATRADRKEAARLLAERWPPAAELSAAALLDDRSTGHKAALEKLTELRSRWRSEHPRLRALHPGSEPTLLRGGDRNPTADEQLSQDLLALSDQSAGKRRAAAIRLAHAVREQPLTDVALGQLETLTLASEDPLVWQTALDIASGDGREPALRVLSAAASHPEGDLRASACAKLARTHDPRFAPLLRAALDDADARVVAAAALALGSCGEAADVAGLSEKLQSPLPEVRLAAAEGLASLAPEEGMAALERLALDRRAQVRQRAVEAMGRSGDATLVKPVVARLGDEAAVRHAALISLRKLAPDAAETILPAGQGAATEETEVAAWRTWAQQNSAKLP